VRWIGVLVAVSLGACSSRTSTVTPEPLHGSAHEQQPDPPQAGAGSSRGDPDGAMITDDQCTARGGKIVTEQTYAHLSARRDPNAPVRPFRICHIPSPKNGAVCRDETDCAGGRCFCTGALARPDPQSDPKLRALDGTQATGQCSDEPVPSGSWYCLVGNGKVQLSGIIVD
jgi:hypothetical protein